MAAAAPTFESHAAGEKLAIDFIAKFQESMVNTGSFQMLYDAYFTEKTRWIASSGIDVTGELHARFVLMSTCHARRGQTRPSGAVVSSAMSRKAARPFATRGV